MGRMTIDGSILDGCVVYLAGPMTNVKGYNREKFADAEEYLSKVFDCRVLNPGKLPVGLRNYQYMPICLSMINAADTVALLPGWEDSAGAKTEKKYAEYMGKQIVYLVERKGERTPGEVLF